MSMNPWVGWSISSLALWALNGGNTGSNDQSDSTPEALSVTETSTGTPIPVVIGRALIKSPLTIFYGDFRADKYTETYAAHANFSAWPLVFELIMNYIAAAITGHQATAATTKTTGTGGNSAGPVTVNATGESVGGTYKDDLGGPLMNALFNWLLMWLINGRNLKTTMQKGFKYYLGYQQLVCWSNPGMRIRTIWMGQEKCWEGDEAMEAHTPNPFVASINDGDLFGGVDENGGFIGELHVYLGGKDQIADPWMVNQMNATSVQEELRGLTPAYRPYVSVVVPTSYVGKQPNIPETWYEMQFIPDGLGLGAIGEEANPAEILYEIHKNNNWGLGQTDDTIDVDSLKAAGEVLKKEGLGITVTIANKAAARTVIDAICDHIDMVRYQDPQTGKLTYKLIRDDYDISKLVVMDSTNCSKITFNRLDWRETVSEISVTYTDRNAQYEQSSINDNDPSIIELAEGNKVTKTYDYPYFTIAENALWAAKRESYQQGYPLATGSIEGDRTLYSLRTGDVAVLNWEPYGISNLLIRVTDIDLGDYVDGKITIEFIEDLFGLGKADYGFSGSTNWHLEDKYPTGAQYFKYMEMPYELIPDGDTYVYALVAKPDVNTVEWTVWRDKEPIGWTSTNNMTNWTPAGTLVYDYAEFTDYVDMVGIELVNLYGLDKLDSATLPNGAPDITAARNGRKLVVIGSEIIAWSSITRIENGNWRLGGLIRGVYDTVPQTHAGKEVAWFLEGTTYANVTTGGPVCKKGLSTTESYNVTTASDKNSEVFNPDKAVTLTTVRRAERPTPPGHVQMACWKKDKVKKIDNVVGDLALHWMNRNKVFQSYGITSQDDDTGYYTGVDFTLPDGANYLIRVYVGGDKVAEYTTTTTEFAYTWGQRCRDSANTIDQTTVEITTVLNSLESYQPQRRSFNWEVPQMIDACISLDEAQQRMLEWENDELIAIPDGTCSDAYQRTYDKFNIFILGTKTSEGTSGAVVSFDGEYILPNGKGVIIIGKETYQMIDLDSYYSFRSKYIKGNNGGEITYSYK
jgi:hypothetical protein